MSYSLSSLHFPQVQNRAVMAEPAPHDKPAFALAVTSSITEAARTFEEVQLSQRFPRSAALSSVTSQPATSSLPPSTAPNTLPNAPLKGRDPLYSKQWHLKNTGQYTFTDRRPTPGIDLNIANLHRIGVTGAGVVVGVLEADGSGSIDDTHEELVGNMVVLGEVEKPSPDNTVVLRKGEKRSSHNRGPSRKVEKRSSHNAVVPRKVEAQSVHNTVVSRKVEKLSSHGTAVAGIIAAVGGNNKGGRGVAPQAKILDLSRPEAKNMPLPRVINESRGSRLDYFEPYHYSADYADSHQDAPLIVRSAGNGFRGNERLRAQFAKKYPGITEENHVGFRSTNVRKESSQLNAVTVGAVNAAGKKAAYSMTGSSLWVSGLSGGVELGFGGSAGAANLPPSSRYAPAIIAPDIMSCDHGMNAPNIDGEIFRNTLEPGGALALDPPCGYTARFSGTSAAAPTVTGVVALMLQVNPKLSWRDIKYLLAITARKVDADREPIRWKGLTLEDGWVTNAAQRSFSNWYGFGLVDAKRAVEAARVFRGLPPAIDSKWKTLDGNAVPIPYRDEKAGYSALRFEQDMKVEAVQIFFRTTHKAPHNLRIALTSPSGTRSIILPPLTDVSTVDGENFSVNQVTSNAFLDENAKGVWKLQIIDVLNPQSEVSTLRSWGIRILGHQD